MKIIRTEIPDVLIFEPKVFGDSRGFFFESFNKKIFDEAVNRNVEFVQDNHSLSAKGVLRGLHYQIEPFAQGKLVRCIEGEVYDVAVDIRDDSPTYGKWVGVNLSADNHRQLWIPEGFAHGFLTLSERAQFAYKTTNYYHPQSDRGIIWNDPDINIQWPSIDITINLSEKDKVQPSLKNIAKV
ncbi:dTDP-4-dehydrorhamnose 3,5-epimerase [Atlantibacter subterraneus]|uniref:dTDP-4-dehydrorhamnose 3,5-epimerase n=1 Tax=Atlantibacter subterraneus TaxID=255519 RepID=UPI0028A7B9E5|nr:dTDP-4-dehydrorhamnose 3,5-epimerase [Atlantibacter subterranea]